MFPSWFHNTLREFQDYIERRGGPTTFYGGIAADPQSRLFVDHNVQKDGGCWIYADFRTDDLARAAERYLHQLGCRGSYGGGDCETTWLYAYRITRTTVE